MAALAAYIRKIRKARGHTQESLAHAVGMAKRTIERLERNEGDISLSNFIQILAELKASPEHVYALASNPTATAETGKILAYKLLASEEHQTQTYTDEFEEALTLMQVLINNPQAYQRWIGYGQGLLDQLE